MNENILVSIIIPTYNRAHILKDTLDSVLSQTYRNWECIIIDDNSNDDTDIVVKDYLKKDCRFLYIKKPNKKKQSASVSRNIGLKLSKGKYIQFLDSDDILAKNKIENQLTILLEENSFAISVCKWEVFDSISNTVKSFKNKDDYRHFDDCKEYFNLIGIHGGFYPPECFLISKKLINFSGYWNENLTINDDGEFFFRIILNSTKIVFAENTFVLHRNYTDNNLSILNTEIKATHLVSSWKIIEALYQAKFKEMHASYLNKKKEAVYNELRKKYPQVIKKNKFFFKDQIKKDSLFVRFRKIKKRILNKLKIIFKIK